MAGIIAGSIAGWTAIDRRDEDGGPSRLPRLHDRSELEKEPGGEVHPDTKANGPVLADGSHSITAPPSQPPKITAATSQQLTPPTLPPSMASHENLSRPHPSP